MNTPPFNSDTSFIDLMMVMVMGFVVLLALAMTMINPPKKKNSEVSPIEIKSDMLITLEWGKGLKSDVDLLVELPNKNLVFFNNRNVPGSNLDRDDLGEMSDILVLPDGTTQRIQENWEHVFVTKLMPGWYTVNALLFKKSDKGNINYKVKVEKFQPYELISLTNGVLVNSRDEDTAVSFNINSLGIVVEQNSRFRKLFPTGREVYND